MKTNNILTIIAALAFFAGASLTPAQCPQICDGGFRNTAVGNNALVSANGVLDDTAIGTFTLGSETTGSENTAIGSSALANQNGAANNTGVGAFALAANVNGSSNTAVGWSALTGQYPGGGNNNTASGYQTLFSCSTGSNNTANGYQALFTDTTGSSNVATGYSALFFNKTGSFNTATGRGALYKNTASNNTADGYQALNKNTTGTSNTAEGYQALFNNTTASGNTATGYWALNKCTGNFNTAHGELALYSNTNGNQNAALGEAALYGNTSGSNNIAVGANAGVFLTTGSNNIDIGNLGLNGESSTVRLGTVGTQTNTYIAGISGVTVAGGIGVIVDGNGHMGTIVSAARYKENIQPMEKASEAILSLQPVTFRYKKELDPHAIPQFGLVAEQVEKVNADLVARDSDGKPYSVRYEAVNAMLLNEFLKEHHKMEEQAKTLRRSESDIAQLKSALAAQKKNFESRASAQEKEIAALAAGLQRVSARLESRATVARVVAKN